MSEDRISCFNRLHIAIENNDIDAVRELLPAGYTVAKEFGYEFIRKACSHGYKQIARLLLEAGISPNHQKLALLNDVLEQIGKVPSVFRRDDYIEIFHLLLSYREDPNTGASGDFPLHLACDLQEKYTRDAMLLSKTLLEHGADMNKPNDHNETPLMKAVDRGHTNVVKLLLSRGADVNAFDNDGLTALFDASRKGDVELTRLLLNHGADVNKTDNTGATPLHFAASTGKSAIVRILLEGGAQAVATDDNVSTALDLATDLSVNNPAREEIINLFRQHAPELVMEAWCRGNVP
jgi:hypothetical protein